MKNALAFLCVALLGLEHTTPCPNCGWNQARGWRTHAAHIEKCPLTPSTVGDLT